MDKNEDNDESDDENNESDQEDGDTSDNSEPDDFDRFKCYISLQLVCKQWHKVLTKDSFVKRLIIVELNNLYDFSIVEGNKQPCFDLMKCTRREICYGIRR